MKKHCKYCNTTQNLMTRTVNNKLQIFTICKSCWYNVRHNKWINKTEEEKQKIKDSISKGTKKAMSNLSEVQLKKIGSGLQNFIKSLSEEDKSKFYKNRGKAISNSDKNEDRKKHIGEYWKNASQEVIDERTKKYNYTLQNSSEEEKAKRKINKSKTMLKRWENSEFKEKMIITFCKAQANMSEETKISRSKKISKSKRESWNNVTDEYRKKYGKKMSLKYKNMSEEKKLKFKEKISLANVRRLNKAAENGTLYTSKKEDKCFEYIKENIDPRVKRQSMYGKWCIDFYLPKYKLYAQFDGAYWHGHLYSEKQYKETKCGRAILKTKQKDIEQNKKIKNLIRIQEEDFDNDKSIVDLLVKRKILTNIMNELY